MTTSRVLSTAFFLLVVPGLAWAQSPIVIPGLLSVDENAEGVDQIFARDLAPSRAGPRPAAAGQIDPSGYLRTNLDGMPAEILDGLLPLGATLAPLGQDPSVPRPDPARCRVFRSRPCPDRSWQVSSQRPSPAQGRGRPPPSALSGLKPSHCRARRISEATRP